MSIIYRRASLEMLDWLVSSRIEVLRAANQLGDDVDMRKVAETSRRYYQEALANSSHVGLLAFDGDAFVGAGGISFYKVMPTYHNPSGKKAYIMNMYVRPEYRRQGIALRMLDMLVTEARDRGITQISLEATDAGRPLYAHYGFVPMEHEMELPEGQTVSDEHGSAYEPSM